MTTERFSHRRLFDRDGRRHVRALWSETGRGGVVVTAHYLATGVGVAILEGGGNAVDAAVGASLALGVCEPASSGLGGMASALVHLAEAGRTFGVDGSCLAPAGATPEAVAGSRRYRGYRAVAVPRYVAAMRHLLDAYGTLAPEAVLAPAIALAEEGFPQTRLQRDVAREYRRPLAKSTAASFFLDARHGPRPVGARIRQAALARTLRRLAASGLEDFYLGAVAREIVEDVEAHDGFLNGDDLEVGLTVSEMEPLIGSFDGSPVATLGPPFGGLTLLQMLHMADHVPKEVLSPDTEQGIAGVAALIRRARLDRKRYRLQIREDNPEAVRALLGADNAERAAREGIGELSGEETGEGETSHVVVFDRAGNAVSLTQSIERSFGAAVVTPALGFLYNGYLRAFKVRNRRHPHFLRPYGSARSNAAPTILLDADGARVALGSTGSERMCSGMFEVLLRLRSETPFAAVHGPRLHCTPEGEVLWERARFPAGCHAALLRSGFTLTALPSYSFKVGGLQLALRNADGSYTGVSEPRRDGAAGGATLKP